MALMVIIEAHMPESEDFIRIRAGRARTLSVEVRTLRERGLIQRGRCQDSTVHMTTIGI